MWPCDELVLRVQEEARVENGRMCLEETIPDYFFFFVQRLHKLPRIPAQSGVEVLGFVR